MPRTSRSLSFDTPDKDTGLSSLEASPVEAQTAGLPASLLSLEQLRSVIESLLFVAGRPLDFGELRRLLLVEERRLREATRSLAAECEAQGRGLRVQLLGNTAQFVSAPENARFVAALLGLPTQVKLTTAALETLAVVAYRQPITRSQIEFIRGVNSDRRSSARRQSSSSNSASLVWKRCPSQKLPRPRPRRSAVAWRSACGGRSRWKKNRRFHQMRKRSNDCCSQMIVARK
jgi:putative transcriptional regulator (Ypuh-like)